MEKSASSNQVLDHQRPTEAQLRWAQFHHKTRAREVQEKVNRLYETPRSVKEVDGALSDDGASTASEESSTRSSSRPARRGRKPRISRGRRALLKASQRSYEKRRSQIAQQGFQCIGGKENDQQDNIVNEKEKRKRNRPRRKEDEDRKSRFAAAFAMLNNMKPTEEPMIVRSTKRWTRPQNTTVEEIGTNFQDWKWGLARRKRTASNKSRLSNMPFDRRATWLVHLPNNQSSVKYRRYTFAQPLSSDGEYLEPVTMDKDSGAYMISPGQHHFDDMVNRLSRRPGAPIPEQSTLNVSARYLDQLPKSEPVQSPRVVRRPRNTSYDPHEREEELQLRVMRRSRDGVGARFEQNVLYEEDEVEYEHLHTAQRSRGSFGERYEHNLMEQRGRVSEAHSFASGSDFFEKARRMHDTTPVEFEGDGSRRFVMNTSVRSGLGAIPETKQPRPSGAFNKPWHRDDIGEEFDHERAGPNYYGYDIEDNHITSPHSSSLSVGGRSDALLSVESQTSPSTDISTPRTQSREKGSLFDNATPESESGYTDRTRSIERAQGGDQTPTPSSTTSSFRMGASKIAGGFFNLVTGKGNSVASSGHDSAIRAVAAFRKTQDGKRDDTKTDGSVSTSSFRGLPEGIRKLVLGDDEAQSELYRSSRDESRAYGQDPPPQLLQNRSSYSTTDPPSPSRSFSVNSGSKSLSPEHGRFISQRITEESRLIGDADGDNTIIDTDAASDEGGVNPDIAASLLMSPTILTKRHQQAIKAIERRNWEQSSYLVNANPWLAEMTDVTTNQYLLHKLALYGASKFLFSDSNDAVDVVPAAPQELNEAMVRLFPSSVHKFDQDGNLPLHMAAASGNVEMAILLGDKFSSGASVRNNDGMLPLHLAVQACANPLANAFGEIVYGADFVALICQLFPGAVAVADSEGDLPLHIAAANLEGEVGVDILYLLLDEADRQAKSEEGLRFVEKVKSKIDDDCDDNTIATETPTESSNMDEDTIHCSMVRNEMGRTALTKAIEAGSGWQVIEAIAGGPGGSRAALMQDVNKCNALHLLLSEEYGDPQAALSILKVAPQAATVRNGDGMLPIEIACRSEMPEDVILAIVLVDTPVDLSTKDNIRRKGDIFGGSWWFLTCECDDLYVDLVEEVVSICSYNHLRQLCLMDGMQFGGNKDVLTRATPLCRQVLVEALQMRQTAIEAADQLYNSPESIRQISDTLR